jgi:rare lipoprotein A
MMRATWISTGLVLACSLANAGTVSAQESAKEKKQFSGIASFYGLHYSGRTARGDRYDGRKFTAAHRTLPFGTRLLVTAPHNKRSVLVIVNDRGPFVKGRVLDLSLAAAQELQMVGRGLIKVTASIE